MPINKDKLNKSNQQEIEQEAQEPNTLILEDQSLRYGFIQLPKQVLYAHNLSRDAKLLYAILLGYAWQKDSCFPGYTRLCQDMQASENMVRKYMRELEALKILSQKRRGLGKTNIYTLHDLRTSKIEVQEPQKSSPQKPQFSKDKEYISNNIQKNNTKHISKGQSPFSQKGTGNGSTPARSHIAGGTIGKQNTTGSVKPSNGEASKASTKQPKLTQPPITQDEIDRNRRRGKNTSGFTSIGELIGIPQSHLFELNHQFNSNDAGAASPPNVTEHTSRLKGNWKRAPLLFQSVIAEWFSLEMHDQAVHSTITRVHRIFEEWLISQPDLRKKYTTEEQQEIFYNLMQDARTKVKYANIKTKTPTGQANKVPYFLTCLENLSGLKGKAKPPN